MASARTASIRRCSLEKVRAPSDSKNWLGRITSGMRLRWTLRSTGSAATRYLADLKAHTSARFRAIAIDAYSPCVSSCPATILNLIQPDKIKWLKKLN